MRASVFGKTTPLLFILTILVVAAQSAVAALPRVGRGPLTPGQIAWDKVSEDSTSLREVSRFERHHRQRDPRLAIEQTLRDGRGLRRLPRSRQECGGSDHRRRDGLRGQARAPRGLATQLRRLPRGAVRAILPGQARRGVGGDDRHADHRRSNPRAIIEGEKGCGGCHRIGRDEGKCDSCHTRHLFAAAGSAPPRSLHDLPHGLRPPAVGDVLHLQARVDLRHGGRALGLEPQAG